MSQANDLEVDPRRWLSLAVLLLALTLIVLDNTVLNVAVPTIIRELDTDLSSVQWVIAGYSLTFATLLVIGGKLGDLYGARRMFIIGATLFGIGSAVASQAGSVGQLLVGESVIEGIGAALMMPATLSIVSNTFRGRERATAFAIWGTVMGAGMAFGPLLGGYLAEYHSWRWAFRINVLVAPVAVVGALLLVRRDIARPHRERLDIPGAVLVGLGTFCLVFGISQGERYGWTDVLILGAFIVAAVAIVAFVAVERRNERIGAPAVFELGLFSRLRFRYGIMAQFALANGQMGQFFVLPLFLQDVHHLSPAENGLWMLPLGIMIFVGAQLSGRLTHAFGATPVVRIGLVLNVLGVGLMAVQLDTDVAFSGMLPAFALFGFGVGLASSQLTSVILGDVDEDKSGVASGANSTSRQVGSALGVAIMSAVLATGAVTDTARPALWVATAILGTGTALAFLIPGDPVDDEVSELAGVVPAAPAPGP